MPLPLPAPSPLSLRAPFFFFTLFFDWGKEVTSKQEAGFDPDAEGQQVGIPRLILVASTSRVGCVEQWVIWGFLGWCDPCPGRSKGCYQSRLQWGPNH